MKSRLMGEVVLFGLIVVVLVLVIYLMALLAKPTPPMTCEQLAEWPLKDIPGRCVSYWADRDGGRP